MRKFCPAGPEHVHRIRRRACGVGAGARKNYVSSYDRCEPTLVIYFLRFVGGRPIMQRSSASCEGDKLYFPKSSDAWPRIPAVVTIVITRSS